MPHTQLSCASYPLSNHAAVVNDIRRCTRQYPTLHPVIDTFKSPDGSSKPLIALRGTVPIVYKALEYQIPIHIWLMSYHPAGPPRIFVVPTINMIFRNPHPHVDHTNGMLYMSYLSDWNPHSSTLTGAVNAMVQVFSVKPPVYARPVSSSRTNLIRTLTQQILRNFSNESARVRTAKQTLATRTSQLSALHSNLHSLQSRKSRLQFRFFDLEARLSVLQMWHKYHPEPPADAHIDSITHPRHVQTAQRIELKATDLSYNDAMDFVDEAFVKRVISVDTYIRQLRQIARAQFFARALVNKLNRALPKPQQQQSASIPPPPSLPPPLPPPRPLPHRRVPGAARPSHIAYKPRRKR